MLCLGIILFHRAAGGGHACCTAAGLIIQSSTAAITAAPIAIELKRGGDAVTQDGAQEQPTALPKPKSDPPQSVQAPENQANQQTLERLGAASKPSQATSATATKPVGPSKSRVLETRHLAEQIVLFDQRARKAQGDARRRDLSTAGALSAAESAYLAMWRRKCERIGGNNYPAGRLQGELTLRVSIHHTGRLLNVGLLRSSGHQALDAAALKTVRQAAPYQPFNVDMRKRYDELTFTRTWQFSRSGSSLMGQKRK